MSRTRRKKPESDLRPEYNFDYSKAASNRFAPRMQNSTIAVVLERDVAEVFQTSEAVNGLLRSVITAVRKAPKREPGRKPRRSASSS
ncbi:MAG: hypothetical protein JOZ10_09685 [Acidobacteria bacterium]|nr:hypothetical protein [Acidobacteriota bacterium]